MEEDAAFYEGEVLMEQPHWYWSKPTHLHQQQLHTRLTVAEARRARLHDRLCWAALAAILMFCAYFTATDPGVAPQLLASTAHLAAPNLISSSSSSSSYRLSVYSTVTGVDLKAGVLELELLVQHPTGSSSYCSSGQPPHHELALGSTSHGAAQLVLPLCSGLAAAGTPVRVLLPLVHQGAPHPFDEHSVDVRLRLQPSHRKPTAAGSTASSTTSSSSSRPSSSVNLEMDWHGAWAVQGLQASVTRKLPGLHARLLAAAAGSGPDKDGGWGSSLLHQLGPAAAASGLQQEAVYTVRLARSPWLRITHLTAALVQVVAVGWACLLLLGQCLAYYLLQRFLCSRLHGVWS